MNRSNRYGTGLDSSAFAVGGRAASGIGSAEDDPVGASFRGPDPAGTNSQAYQTLTSGQPTGNVYLDSLIDGCKWTGSPIRYAFAAGDPNGDLGFAGKPWTAGEKSVFVSVLQSYSAVCNLTFAEATTADANILWFKGNNDQLGGNLGWHDFPNLFYPQIYGVFNNDPGYWNASTLQAGGDAYDTVLHEIGHGLGLAHPHDGGDQYDATIFPGAAPFYIGTDGMNQSIWTVMSYNAGWAGQPSNTLAYGQPLTPMAFDIAALQTLYGANLGYHTGGDVYVLPAGNGAGTGWSCIWDAGGADTISAYGTLGSATIDLRGAPLTGPNAGGYVSWISGIAGGFTIANGVTVENAIGGGGKDTLIGNSADNRLTGGSGQDTLTGGAGVDTFAFAIGDSSAVYAQRDLITDFNLGIDKIDLAGIDANALLSGMDAFRYNGWAGFDGAGTLRLTYNNAGLTMLEGDTNGDGVADFGIGLSGALNLTTKDFAAGSVALPVTLTGDAGANTLIGGAAGDTLIGNGGDDMLDGRGGPDRMTGGTGNDTYFVDHAGDTVTEQPGEGTDLVRSRISYTLGAEVENLTLGAGAGNINGTGNGLDNVISGNEGANTLIGGAGADTLTGGAGADKFVFATGDTGATAGTRDVITDFAVGVDKLDLSGIDADTLASGQDVFRFLGKAGFDGAAGALHTVFDAANNQTILEADTDGDGNADFQIALNGNLTLGTGDFTPASLLLPVTLAGDGNANTLTGGALNDTLSGNGGDDTLDGGKGADQMTGGLGNDTYFVDNAGDVVTELAGQGIDTVRARINYTLGANVENLTLEAGAGNLSATGNTLNNTIIGNDGDNTITGGAGIDTLTGGTGVDTFVFAPGDTSSAYAQRDLITDFTLGVDKIDLSGIDANTLLSGIDAFRLNGWAGFDGAGSLRLTYNNAGLTMLEGDTNGDGVADFGIGLSGALSLTTKDITSSSLALPVTLTGDGNANTLTGGAMNDTLSGGAGDDILDGGKGADQMTGGTDNDTYYVDNIGDMVTEQPGEGTADLVRSRISYTLGAEVENLTLEAGAGNINGTGNSLGNVITGNEGANTLTGGAGADQLTGGAGADKFVFATGDTGATAGTRDVITDFAVGVDKLDLSGIDADTLASGQDAFRFLGKAGFDGVAGALHTVFDAANNQTILEGDTDGDGNADFQIALNGNLTLGTGDFTPASLLLPVTLAGDGNANTLTGGALNDTLSGNGGDDTLDGGKGADQMTGGLGNDTYFVDNAGDVVTELAGQGTDLVRSKIAYTLGANVENLTLEAGAGNLSATGNALNNTIIGNDGDNTITGGAGIDTLTGGTGVDTFVFAPGDTSSAYAQRDLITDFTLGVDKIDLSAIDANTLLSGMDAFRLNGWAGFDGAGSLRLTYNNAGLTMLEGDTNGDGVADFGIGLSGALSLTTKDITSSSLALPVTLTGDGNANTLTGGAMNDTLSGGAGDDILDGGKGADQMAGNGDNDTYYVDNIGDMVTEQPGEGTDLVRSRISYTLGAEVENLTLEAGAGNINGTGNSLGNVITGNEGANTLTGGAGADTLTGGAGADKFVFAGGDLGATAGTRDVVTDFAVGVDKLDLSGIDADTLASGQDAFRFLGKAGFDGAAGALHTAFDAANNQTILEGDTDGDGNADFQIALNGNLTLGTGDFTPASLLLPVTLTGDGNANTLTGGALNDTLSGNGGDDTLDGGKGADQMTGGLGNDTYFVDNAGDVVTELAGQGTDLVRATVSHVLAPNVENLTLEAGFGNIAATGNALNNTIIGNDGNNTITGGAGLDTLTGGAGVDTFVFAPGDTNSVYAQRDLITDFTVGVDKIDLSAIDANTLVAGTNAFHFNGWAGFNGAGSLRLTYNNAGLTMIEGDTNGDGVADFGIGLKATGGTQVTAGDFAAGSLTASVRATASSLDSADVIDAAPRSENHALEPTLEALLGNLHGAGSDTATDVAAPMPAPVAQHHLGAVEMELAALAG